MRQSFLHSEEGFEKAALDLFFLAKDGDTFKATVIYRPYFYIAVKDYLVRDMIALLERRMEGKIAAISPVEKDDLDMINHLSGKKKTYLKLEFSSVQV